MVRLRDPTLGCPWDREQDFASIAPYTIEEAYEVADAIARGDLGALKEELGDLLFQVVFHARMAEEAGAFDFEAVAEAIADKMTRRHPHVFGTARIADADAQTVAWESHKAAERHAKKPNSSPRPSVLDDVPLALPALLRAQKLQKRVARVGFDWKSVAPALDKVEEEIGELRQELAGSSSEKLAEEIGDLLFACVNVARHAGADAEGALRAANAKFERRFHWIEAALAARGKTPEQSDLDEMEALWEEAKSAERAPPPGTG
ncbi:MAG: nucleoside triphosphate pyrophosphohydrolase [Rhodospirillaceae bacterium]|nr:nucleoside triphosphate pyrophosphohydrolase [Rhodospirillaceae bacterium]